MKFFQLPLAIALMITIVGCNTSDVGTHSNPGTMNKREATASAAVAGTRQVLESAKEEDAKAPRDGEDSFIEKHVRIEFPQSHYTFTIAQVAKGIEIRYQIVADQDVRNVNPQSQFVTGTVEPQLLQVFEELSGNGQSYSIRDKGLGPGLRPGWVITVQKGTDSRVFQWDGKNWEGPSDTGRPKGRPFPLGKYTLRVSTVGGQKVRDSWRPFRVEASVPVTLVNSDRPTTPPAR
jgi:hypothetical protein